MAIKLIAFDLFGTLFTSPNWEYYRALLRATSSLKIHDYMRANQGLESIISKEQYTAIQALTATELTKIKVYPETEEVLLTLWRQGYQLAVISNLSAPFRAILKNSSLFSYLTNILYSCEVGAIKPEKQIYQALLNDSKCQSQDILMVGDNEENDYLEPQRQGMQALWLRREDNSRNDEQISQNPLIIKDLWGVIEWLKYNH